MGHSAGSPQGTGSKGKLAGGIRDMGLDGIAETAEFQPDKKKILSCSQLHCSGQESERKTEQLGC